MSPKKYFLINSLLAMLTFAIGYFVFWQADELRYIKFQLAFTILFSVISIIIYISLQIKIEANDDVKAIGISMGQSFFKLALSLGLLIPFYFLFCPINNYYLLNFIITYLIYMVFDTYVMTRLEHGH